MPHVESHQIQPPVLQSTTASSHTIPLDFRLNIWLSPAQGPQLLHRPHRKFGLVLCKLRVAHRPPLHQAPMLAVQVAAARLVVLVSLVRVLAAAALGRVRGARALHVHGLTAGFAALAWLRLCVLNAEVGVFIVVFIKGVVIILVRVVVLFTVSALARLLSHELPRVLAERAAPPLLLVLFVRPGEDVSAVGQRLVVQLLNQRGHFCMRLLLAHAFSVASFPRLDRLTRVVVAHEFDMIRVRTGGEAAPELDAANLLNVHVGDFPVVVLSDVVLRQTQAIVALEHGDVEMLLLSVCELQEPECCIGIGMPTA
ncbi:hypothetical protein TPAR_06890 [Tolypocladium paradoxum]|uniref:Uncharacterized protein n=1 Tax=Tolypocladium paradoxum TaxID=94208 RepID=A0A2S4KRX7_9HYPO|nr:hypothetical protein TPAR_06890 [Tolypocladium paradoxum]